MTKLTLLLSLFMSYSLGAAEPLESFKMELSCTRQHGSETYTIMIRAVIVYDGEKNTCTAEKGKYVRYNENYDIPFKCEKIIPVTADKRHPLQLWTWEAPANADTSRINKVVFLMNHETKIGSGVATAPNGTAHEVRCKKW